MKKINISEFKSKCLGIIDWVNKSREAIIILKHGKAIAEVRFYEQEKPAYPQLSLKGQIRIKGDLTQPTIQDKDIAIEKGLV